MARLPPGVSASDFAAAVEMFKAAVGANWVFTNDEDLNPYRDAFSTVWGTPDELIPAGAVSPTTVEQVQAIVRAANRYKIPLFPISTGKNFAYGGPTANVSGSVIVDLKRMNRVIEVDEDRHFALVEPGVSYFDLYRYIQDRGLKVWVDCPDPGWGSPVGNALDHGIGYTMGFYRDHFGAHCGMEVVLANGEVMRTGMGALPNAKSWQDFKYGYGPDTSGLFGQGNYGIVTKMGFRLMPQPEYYRTGMITVPKRRDFIQLVKTVNYLSDSFLIGEPIYGSPLRSLMSNAAFMTALEKPGGPADAELDRFAADNNLHSWSVELQFYGPEKTCLGTWEYAKQRFADDIPGAKTFEGENLKVPLTPRQLLNLDSPYPTTTRRNITQGVPSLGIWKILGTTATVPDVDGTMQGHVGFIPVVPRTGEAVFEAQRVFGDAMKEFDLPRLGSALHTPTEWYQFAFQMGFSPFTSRNNPAHNAKVDKALRRMIEIAAEHGWGDYRSSPSYQDAVVNAYSFNKHVLRKFKEQLKDAVDPNGILAPGRGGVWPLRFRHMRKI
jgi:FAD/FMN-containing dehydrogenase